MAELETEVRLLKRELEEQTKIHDRLDVAIEKLTDVSNSIHRMLAVHEEKIARQEEAIVEAEQQIEIRRGELMVKIDELHSRITTNTKEIMTAAAQQHAQQNKEIQKWCYGLMLYPVWCRSRYGVQANTSPKLATITHAPEAQQ